MPSWAINVTKFQQQIKLKKMEKTSKNNETAQLGIGAVRRSLNLVNYIICVINDNGIHKLNTKDFTTEQAAITWLQYNGIKNVKYCIIKELSLY